MSNSDHHVVLQTRNLAVGFDQPILSDVNLEIPLGEWWTVLGPNGCGKTTLLDTLSGRLPPLSGHIDIAGHSLLDAPLQARQRLGYAVPPDRLPARLTGRECLNVFNQAHEAIADVEQVQFLIEAWDFSSGLNQFVDRMSLGMRQKTGLLLAFAGQPELIILDESLNGLDSASAVQLKRFLQNGINLKSFSVLMATHSMDVVSQYADQALVCHEGRVAIRLTQEELREADQPLDQLIAQRLLN